MKRNGCALNLKMCVVLGAVAGVALMGGCPSPTPPEPEHLTVSATGSGEPTVGKTIELRVDASGGTEPFAVQWTQVDGPDVDITDASAATASFVPPTAGFYTFAVDVTDASSTPKTGSAETTVAVGDIKFAVQGDGFVVVQGNPAVLRTTARATAVSAETEVVVYDPEFTDLSSFVLAEGAVDPRNTPEMPVTYSVVSVPTAARVQDVTLGITAGTIENDFGLGNRFLIQANPTSSFLVLTNIGTTVENLGEIVPGDYVFRAMVTNPNGLTRTRDLRVTVLVESFSATFGGSADGPGLSAGPDTVRVRELPQGSPGLVTDKVMTADQTATMTVTVFPSSDTDYTFFLADNNGVAHPELVTASTTDVAADGAAHDITLTIGVAAGMPIGTYELRFESFDGFGMYTAGPVTVNFPAVPVRFHVTSDFLGETSINAALVGQTSNNVDAPTEFEGWTGQPQLDPVAPFPPSYGMFSALADVNLDGALDILTTQLNGTYHIRINVAGFVNGSTEALRHPENNGNFGPALPTCSYDINTFLLPGSLYSFAVGDVNGDQLPDIAIGYFAGGVGQVTVFFHTGDPIQPYSNHVNQTLQLLPPESDRQLLDTSTNILSGSIPSDRTKFGFQVGILDQNGDDQPDLIVTDPGFDKIHVLHVTPVPTPPAVAPPAANTFYFGDEGRVYVFAGGASGELKPGRPAIITSLITEREVTDGSVGPFPDNPVFSTTFAEANTKYALVYEGAQLDLIGHALSNGGAGFAVGSSEAAALGAKMGAIQILNPIINPVVGETVRIDVTEPGGGAGQFRIYEFTDGAPPFNPLALSVPLAGDFTAANALTALAAAINGDAADMQLVTASPDGARPERLNLIYAFGPVDGFPRNITVSETMFGTGNEAIDFGPGLGDFVQNHDGRVYRVAANQASGALTNPINGIQDSNMGLGEVLALGAFNDAADMDDLAITALDPGTAFGVNNGHPIFVGQDDGAVFVLLDGSNTLGAPISGVGATTLRSGTFIQPGPPVAPIGTDLTPTAVGAKLGFGDVNGDGVQELFFTEPGFDQIYMILGAAAPATSPDETFFGVTFADNSTPPLGQPAGGSLSETGTFLFGDITGDTQADWVFLDSLVNFGFVGFAR